MWQTGDQHEAMDQAAYSAHLLNMLLRFLFSNTQRPRSIDDFIAAYPSIWGNVLRPDGSPAIPLLRRGDLVKFVRHHPTLVSYDRQTFVISLPA